MLYWGIVTLVFGVVAALAVIGCRREAAFSCQEEVGLTQVGTSLQRQAHAAQMEVSYLENKMGEYFFFYDLARTLAPLVNREEVFETFFGQLGYLGDVQRIESADGLQPGEYFELALGKKQKEKLLVKTESGRVFEYAIHLSKLLNLCLERITLYERLQELSIYDSLTGMYNRRYFMERYSEEFVRAKKFNLAVSFLMVDIDYFKKVNDTYGHLVGDVVLREVARAIYHNTREIDFVARFGGEEFAIILPETDKGGAIMVADRIRSYVSSRHIRAFDETLRITVSVGIGTFPHNTTHSDVLIETADKALYKAKLEGRNRVCWF